MKTKAKLTMAALKEGLGNIVYMAKQYSKLARVARVKHREFVDAHILCPERTLAHDEFLRYRAVRVAYMRAAKDMKVAFGLRAKFANEMAFYHFCKRRAWGPTEVQASWDAFRASRNPCRALMVPADEEYSYARHYQSMDRLTWPRRRPVIVYFESTVEQRAQEIMIRKLVEADASAFARQLVGGPCCERDHDGDGNCDRHPAGLEAR